MYIPQAMLILLEKVGSWYVEEELNGAGAAGEG